MRRHIRGATFVDGKGAPILSEAIRAMDAEGLVTSADVASIVPLVSCSVALTCPVREIVPQLPGRGCVMHS
jgi:hypothetical protein